MANEIVTQHNDLVELPLRQFNASELDILLAICYKCQNRGTNEVVLKLDDIKSLAHYQNKNKQQFIEAVKSTNRKLLGLNFTIGDDRNFVQFALFPRFAVNLDDGTLSVRVADEFSYLLNNFTGNYTRIELQESAALSSSYAKGMYKMLRRYKDWGKWKVSLDDFREYLDIPKSYKAGHINEKIIKPSIEELKAYFSELRCDPYYEKTNKGRGRPKLMGYEFNFKKQPHDKKKEKEYSARKIAEYNGYEKIGKYCPVCHKEIFKKNLVDEKGESYFLICHSDFKTGGCNHTQNSYEGLLSKADLIQLEEQKKHHEKFTDEERAENKRKLAEVFKSMFK